MSYNISFMLAFALAALVTFLPDLAFATDISENSLDELGLGLCAIAKSLQGTVGKGIATLVIIFLGIGAFFGKVNWGLAVMTAVGIVCIFGAVAIVGTIGDGGC